MSHDPSPDPAIRQLERFFREHPAWVQAGRRIADGASSRVFFRHRPGEPWRLVRREARNVLEPGSAADPDFAFCFTRPAIERLCALEGRMGAFAVTLFELIVEPDAEIAVGFRIVAPFTRLARRGYLRLVIEAGPEVLAFGRAHGVRNLSQLRRLVRELRQQGPAPWEADAD